MDNGITAVVYADRLRSRIFVGGLGEDEYRQSTILKRNIYGTYETAIDPGCCKHLFLPGNGLQAQNNFLDFDGTDDQVVNPALSELARTQQFTIEFWAKIDVLNAWNALFTNSLVGSASNTNRIFVTVGAPGAGGTDDLAVGVGNGSNFGGRQTNCNCITAGAWHHVAFSFDGTQANAANRYIVHIDGVSVPLSGTQGIPTSVNPVPPLAFILGNYPGATGSSFDGQMDEVRVWDHVRTTAQITSNKNMTLTGSEPGLLRYYDFNSGACGGNNAGVTTLTDLGSFGANGTLQNFALNGCNSNWVCVGTTCGYTAPFTASTVPTLGQWGLILFCLLLLCTGAVMLHRRRTAYATN